MSITDELRKYAQSYKNSHDAWSGIGDDLDQIADRIDAEHERQLEVLYRDMSDAEYVKLPKDADSEYIHIGDRMEWVRYGDDDPTIVRTVIGVGFEAFFAWSDEQGRYAQYEAHAYRHHHAPTVEDVLLDACKAYHSLMVESTSDVAHDMPAPSEVIAEYAAKLRLAEGEDA